MKNYILIIHMKMCFLKYRRLVKASVSQSYKEYQFSKKITTCDHIQMATQKSRKIEFLKDIFKPLGVTVYVKTIEKSRKRRFVSFKGGRKRKGTIKKTRSVYVHGSHSHDDIDCFSFQHKKKHFSKQTFQQFFLNLSNSHLEETYCSKLMPKPASDITFFKVWNVSQWSVV